MRKAMLTVTAMGAIAILSSCASFRFELYSDINLDVDYKYGKSPKKKTVERLIVEIWNSGFINRNRANEEEIFNNDYGVFKEFTAEAHFTQGRACFIIEKDQKDKILLNKKLFPHFKILAGQDIIHIKLDKRIKATLVHELFHDFWYNLLNPRERYWFYIEAQKVFEEIISAENMDDKLKFLHSIGYVEPTKDNFTFFEELNLLKDNYPQQKFFGTELYAIIAEMAFLGKMIVPKQLRKFYKGIISETDLNKNFL